MRNTAQKIGNPAAAQNRPASGKPSHSNTRINRKPRKWTEADEDALCCKLAAEAEKEGFLSDEENEKFMKWLRSV